MCSLKNIYSNIIETPQLIVSVIFFYCVTLNPRNYAIITRFRTVQIVQCHSDLMTPLCDRISILSTTRNCVLITYVI